MLKRARISLLIAMVAALFGFAGLLEASAAIAQAVCYVFAASAVISFTFALFEEARTPITLEEHEPRLRS